MNETNQKPAVLKVEVALPDAALGFFGIVLAAGSGKRMVDFIKSNYGTDLPKQFVAFTGKLTMIQHTLKRAESVISGEKLLVVVDPRHQQAIAGQLADRPNGTIIYQPMNRETAPGVLLPLSYVMKRDPGSIVAVFPSDHFILEEERFMEHIRFAKRVIQMFPDQIVLLGIPPRGPEKDYGWIEPGDRLLGLNGMEAFQVKGFYEKPDPLTAQIFFEKGFLCNTLVMVARGSTLWDLAAAALPETHKRFEAIFSAIGTPAEEETLLKEYLAMDGASISHEVLAKYPGRLIVIPVKEVQWSDWGNESRVTKTLKELGERDLTD